MVHKPGMKERSKRILSLVRKEMDSLRKDKISLAILFLVPIVMLVTVGSAKMNLLESDTTIWIIDHDNSTKSEEFIESFRNSSQSMHLVTNHDDPSITEELAQREIPKTTLDAYIVIHEGFEADLLANKTTDLEVHIDAIDFMKKASAQSTIIMGATNYQLINLQFERDVFYFPVLEPEESLNLLQLAAPMMVGILLFSTINLASSQCIVGDVPLKRMLTTPTFRFEVLIAKTMAYAIVSVFQ
ncbi:MAG: ABC transporter permease, partial [Promethearchaeota archaeon]